MHRGMVPNHFVNNGKKELQTDLASIAKFILDRIIEKKKVEKSMRSTIEVHDKNRNLTKNIVSPFTHNETVNNLYIYYNANHRDIRIYKKWFENPNY